MSDEKALSELTRIQSLAKSKILEQIAETLRIDGGRVAATMYTKSDGTNYGMYQKEDALSALGDIWERVFEGGVRVKLDSPLEKIAAEQIRRK